MLIRSKKLGSAVVVILFTIMSLVISQLVYSQESELLSEKAILSMDSEERLWCKKYDQSYRIPKNTDSSLNPSIFKQHKIDC